MLTRRELALSAVALTAAGPAAAQIAGPPRPTVSQLRSGDFLWPKPPKSWTPYGPMALTEAISPAGQARTLEQMEWERQREAWLDDLGPQQRNQPSALAIRDMSFQTFADDYYRVAPGVSGPPSFYVGHVAIVEIDPDNGPMVIEATPPLVRRVSYADWLDQHIDDLVFHGRMRGLAPDAETGIAAAARRHVGKRYGFFNFNLLSERTFYCSHLAWCVVWRVTGAALDGDPDPHRVGWFSPKRMFYCDAIQHLNSPGLPGEYSPA